MRNWSIMITGLLLLKGAFAGAQALSVGDTLPSFELGKVINAPKGVLRYPEDVKGKAALIDFWFTSCVPCIANMPKLDSLQKQFAEDLLVLSVTFQDSAQIDAFVRQHKRLKELDLPYVTQDTLLKKWFPHRSMPHLVWIDKSGRVQAITGHEQISKSNLNTLINGAPLNLPLKSEDEDIFGAELPLLLLADRLGAMDKTLKTSYIGAYEPKVKSSFGPPTPYPQLGDMFRLKALNMSIYGLYQLAFYNNSLHPSQFMMADADRSEYAPDFDRGKNLFCYDLLYRRADKEEGYTYMQQDLDQFFGFKSTYKRKRLRCYVIRRLSDNRAIETSKGGLSYRNKTDTTIELYNQSLQSMAKSTFWLEVNYPVINEADLNARLDLVLPIKFDDNLEAVNDLLAKKGLTLSIEERYMNVIELKR